MLIISSSTSPWFIMSLSWDQFLSDPLWLVAPTAMPACIVTNVTKCPFYNINHHASLFFQNTYVFYDTTFWMSMMNSIILKFLPQQFVFQNISPERHCIVPIDIPEHPDGAGHIKCQQSLWWTSAQKFWQEGKWLQHSGFLRLQPVEPKDCPTKTKLDRFCPSLKNQ